MAHGFKDWDVPVSISAQELGEIINRPKYGEAQHVNLATNVSATTKVTLTTISGKGVTYGGYIRGSAAAQMKSDQITITIDGVQVSSSSFSGLKLYEIQHEKMYFIWLVNYDQINFNYNVRITAGITFESSYKIEYENMQGFTVGVYGSLIYATL